MYFFFLLQEHFECKSESGFCFFTPRRPHEGVEWQHRSKSLSSRTYKKIKSQTGFLQSLFSQTKTLTGGGMEQMIDLPIEVIKTLCWLLMKFMKIK